MTQDRTRVDGQAGAGGAVPPPEVCITETWCPTQAEFDAFAALSGDDNPIHVDPDFAAATRFGRTVSHGMLIFARLEALLARAAPGARLARGQMMFPAPCYAGEPVALSVTAAGAGRFRLGAVRVATGEPVFEGLAEVAP